MTDPKSGETFLERAYALTTPDDNAAFYDNFAQHYEQQFVDALGYIYPEIIRAALARHGSAKDRPIADIGCGTGLVAQALDVPVKEIEGFDISEGMLAQARAKGLYGALHRTDLTQTQPAPARPFGALVSAGTFTHGHLGPEVLPNLLPLARSGGLFVLGIKASHFQEAGFEGVLHGLADAGQITPHICENILAYEKAGHAHSGSDVEVLVFRKA